MPVEQTLHRIAEELRRGDLANVLRARQRLAGLVGTYPHRLDLRARLAEVYRVLGDLPQAGRWDYLSETCDPAETIAFEHAYRTSTMRLDSLCWAGDLDGAPTETARARLAALHGEAKIQVQRELDALPRAETSWLIGLLVVLGGAVVVVCFLVGVVTVLSFMWKLAP
ncbi:hypothetical protein FKR81_00015 [Lentzea tibetensis]|uniref:Uncharacterized protein n=1 Tax=Lentzea tibetensis TaxID=2591470 RepID=A0A563F2N3_9PSEU|nr:DUF6584 family protein [Lentzea tibetensis]TWP53998.1 hypothetical protein FKR81_00015 [Lentzea tibetensis]